MLAVWRIAWTGCALLMGCRAEAAFAPKALTAVKVRAISSVDAASGTRYSAEIVPASSVELAFQTGGYVESVTRVAGVDGKLRVLQEGDRVTRGMELARVRAQDYVFQLRMAQAALTEAIAVREQAAVELQNATTLLEANSIAPANHRSLRARWDAAVARAQGAKARSDEALSTLADTRLSSPIDGVVVRRNVEVGALAVRGASVFLLADTSSVKVVFGVPESVRAALELGRGQTVTTEAYAEREFAGRVTHIASIADPKSHLFSVEIALDNADGALRPGMIAALTLLSATAPPPVAVLPLSAIVRARDARDGFAVFALDETFWPPIVRLRDVELGEFLGNALPIRSGIHLGEKVIVQGASLLSDLEPVRVIP